MTTIKKQPDLQIDRLGTHLFNVTRRDGSSFLKWHWPSLEAEVRLAIAEYENNQSPKDNKKNLVLETESQVRKTRAKKAEPAIRGTKAKKPAAKKAAAKKSTSKKKETK